MSQGRLARIVVTGWGHWGNILLRKESMTKGHDCKICFINSVFKKTVFLEIEQ